MSPIFRIPIIIAVSVAIFASEDRAQLKVTLPDLVTAPAQALMIPVKIGDLTGKKVTAFEFVIWCDTNMVFLKGVDQSKTISDGLSMFANNMVAPYNRGRMKVVCASAIPMSGNGTLVNVLATARTKVGRAELKLTNVVLNAGEPEAMPVAGSVTVKVPAERKPKEARRKSE